MNALIMSSARCSMLLLAAALTGACGHQSKKKNWVAAPQNADAAACAVHGGSLVSLSPGEAPLCVTPFPDGGKPCADSSECVGGCHLYSTPNPADTPKKKKKGVCQKANYFRECYREVKDGVAEPGSRCQA